MRNNEKAETVAITDRNMCSALEVWDLWGKFDVSAEPDGPVNFFGLKEKKEL